MTFHENQSVVRKYPPDFSERQKSLLKTELSTVDNEEITNKKKEQAQQQLSNKTSVEQNNQQKLEEQRQMLEIEKQKLKEEREHQRKLLMLIEEQKKIELQKQFLQQQRQKLAEEQRQLQQLKTPPKNQFNNTIHQQPQVQVQVQQQLQQQQLQQTQLNSTNASEYIEKQLQHKHNQQQSIQQRIVILLEMYKQNSTSIKLMLENAAKQLIQNSENVTKQITKMVEMQNQANELVAISDNLEQHQHQTTSKMKTLMESLSKSIEKFQLDIKKLLQTTPAIETLQQRMLQTKTKLENEELQFNQNQPKVVDPHQTQNQPIQLPKTFIEENLANINQQISVSKSHLENVHQIQLQTQSFIETTSNLLDEAKSLLLLLQQPQQPQPQQQPQQQQPQQPQQQQIQLHHLLQQISKKLEEVNHFHSTTLIEKSNHISSMIENIDSIQYQLDQQQKNTFSNLEQFEILSRQFESQIGNEAVQTIATQIDSQMQQIQSQFQTQLQQQNDLNQTLIKISQNLNENIQTLQSFTQKLVETHHQSQSLNQIIQTQIENNESFSMLGTFENYSALKVFFFASLFFFFCFSFFSKLNFKNKKKRMMKSTNLLKIY